MKKTRRLREIHDLSAVMTFMVVGLLVAALAHTAHAQTYSVLHNFTGGSDGGAPTAGLTEDASGNFYGAAANGGIRTSDCPQGCGVTFRFSRRGSNWMVTPLYLFKGPLHDGAFPLAAPTIGRNGTLYGSTSNGAFDCQPGGCGTIYNLKPSATICGAVFCPWSETILQDLALFNGNLPGYGTPVFDASGNIFGTTQQGGPPNSIGTIYELSPSGAGWTQTVINNFVCATGCYPTSGITLDSAGNLYGTASWGGSQNCPLGCGVVYKVAHDGSNWVFTSIYVLQGGSDGAGPWGGVILDQSGNIFGTTSYAGGNYEGTVFELSPSVNGWTYQVLHTFSEDAGFDTLPGPHGNLVMDAAGNLYGTTYEGGAQGAGNVFKLTKTANGWTYASLHDFSGFVDGGKPMGTLVIDANGTIYGTTQIGGSGQSCGINGCGVIWQITQ